MNHIVCAGITDAACEVIRNNGGTVKVISEQPLVQLISLPVAILSVKGYSAFILSSATSEGICWEDDDALERIVYRWDGKSEKPDDESWDHEHISDTLERDPDLGDCLANIEKQAMTALTALIAVQKGVAKDTPAIIRGCKGNLLEIIAAMPSIRGILGIPLTKKKEQ